MFSENYSHNSLVLLTDLTSVEDEKYDYSRTPDVVIYLQLHTRVYDVLESPGPWPQFNNISFDFPSVNMLTQRNSLLESEFCGESPGSHQCIGDFCSCLYTHKIPLNSLVEIIMVDISVGRDQDHPIHIHGNHFHVVAIGVVKENVSLDYVKQLNEEGRIHKKLSNATAKDSISVPNSGYAIVRLKADNPGFWLFHCHVTNHMELGMAMILQVGSYAEMAETPSNFPSCGNWYMNEELQNSSSAFMEKHFVLTLPRICISIVLTVFILNIN